MNSHNSQSLVRFAIRSCIRFWRNSKSNTAGNRLPDKTAHNEGAPSIAGEVPGNQPVVRLAI